MQALAPNRDGDAAYFELEMGGKMQPFAPALASPSDCKPAHA